MMAAGPTQAPSARYARVKVQPRRSIPLRELFKYQWEESVG